MGEREGAGRIPGEVIEVYRRALPPSLRRTEERDPREVVSVYRPPDVREVVEVYSRPVPRGRAARPAAPAPGGEARGRRRGPLRGRRGGLVQFRVCVAVLVGLAAAARAADRLSARDGGGAGAPPASGVSEEIAIPGWPVDQGASLTVSREPGETLTAQEIYRRLNPSVVTVRCWTEEGMSIGTGVIFTEDGYVLTNHHVVRGGRECSVVLDSGYTLTVCYVAGDKDSDLAVLKVPQGEVLQIGGLPAAPFGDSERLVVGDPVYAIGAPRQLRGTLTNGIVSAIDRDIQVEGRTMTLLQTNAALNSGNSGGPLINEQGQVVGINVAKYMSGPDNAVEGLGFSIPTAYLERIVNDLLRWGKVQPEPRLGIMVVTDEWGLLVHSVEPGTAAEAAGIQAGDYIVSAQGEAIRTTQDLFRIRRRLYVGDEVAMTLRRQEETLEVVLALEEAVG